MLTELLEKERMFNYWWKICGKIGHYPHNDQCLISRFFERLIPNLFQPLERQQQVQDSEKRKREKREGKGGRRKIEMYQPKKKTVQILTCACAKVKYCSF